MSSFAIGVDLGGTNLRVAAVDDSGQLLEKVTSDTKVARGREEVLEEMCALIRALSEKLRGAGTLAGTGVGVPGIIDLKTGTLRASPNLPGWMDYPVREAIEQRLGTRVVLENDANAAALGEKWLGAGRAVESLAMLTLGTGVGGGLVLEGEIWHGMTGMAGEMGHNTIDPQGPLCACGNRGCLEQYASATAIRRMAMELIASGHGMALARAEKGNDAFSAKTVYEVAEQGDVAARAIFRKVGWALGIALAGLVNTFNLPMYVVGGGVASAWELFAPAMLEELQQRSFVYATTTTPAGAAAGTVVTRAALGADAGLYGAARVGLGKAAAR
jgi:glucokinase